MRFAIPLIVFTAIVALLGVGLKLNPREVPSPLIGRPSPNIDLPVLDTPGEKLTLNDLQGKPWLLNVWASWCTACLAEHDVLMQLAQERNF